MQFGVTTSHPLVYNTELSMTEQELFARICKGDEQALDFIYRKYYRMMVRLVTSNNGTEVEAKDVYQEAIVVFWQKANSGNLVLTSKMSTYIYSVCLNLWRKELERKKRFSNEEKEEKDVNQRCVPMVDQGMNEVGYHCFKEGEEGFRVCGGRNRRRVMFII